MNIQRDGFESIMEDIRRVLDDHNMVFVDNDYPPGYVNRDETRLVPRHSDSVATGAYDVPMASRETSALWMRAHESNIETCPCCDQDFSRHNAVGLPDVDMLFCSESCQNSYVESNSGFAVATSGGSNQVYVPGVNTAGNLAPYNSLWFPDHHAETTEHHRALIGFEVEKEDEEWHVRGSSETDILAAAHDSKWLAVSDGSLEYDNGFELVSPGYNLTDPNGEYGTEAMQRDFDNLAPLMAKTTSRCGGHITLSVAGFTGEQIARRIEPFYSLLFALYPSRLMGEYARPIRGEDSLTNIRGGKFRAVNVMNDRVEFRIFSAVKTPGQLMNRVELIRALYELILGEDGQPLSIGECRDAIEAAIGKPDSRLMSCVKVLVESNTYGTYAPDTCVSSETLDRRRVESEKRLKRREGFKNWLITGDTTGVSRYLTERIA